MFTDLKRQCADCEHYHTLCGGCKAKHCECTRIYRNLKRHCEFRLVNLPARWGGFDDSHGYQSNWIELANILKEAIPVIFACKPIKRGLRALEIGVGSGKWSAAFAIMGFETWSMDYSTEILEQAHRNFPFVMTLKVKADIRESRRLDIGQFDLVFSEGLLEHYVNPDERHAILTNMGAYVKDEGFLVLIVPHWSKEPDELQFTAPRLAREIRKASPDMTVIRTEQVANEIHDSAGRVVRKRLNALVVTKKEKGQC